MDSDRQRQDKVKCGGTYQLMPSSIEQKHLNHATATSSKENDQNLHPAAVEAARMEARAAVSRARALQKVYSTFLIQSEWVARSCV